MTPEEIRDLAQLLAQVPSLNLRVPDVKDVRRLAELLRESPEVGSIELKGPFGTGVVLTRTGFLATAPAAPVYAAAPAPASSATSAPASAPAAAPAEAPPAPAAALKEVKSPMVGTFYKAPEPGAEAYVKVGTRVAPGQTICIIEAMKIMNEIEAEVAGVVKEICVDDTSPVEFGQVLFRVDPHG
ncbi:MAG: acetyl-CoA carboxylase biotin carboxyl carrier protein [Gemmatimonadales bacterium]|nr:acetyl-CoA carboxylase biotin carboxyl carrier protein [Gemmatimonadales bacterium]